MFILGLTGSIGMGKSTTAKFFAEAGVPVHDADAVVHRLYEGEATAAIEAAFPGTTANGKVDRDQARPSACSAMPPRIKRLEAIVHPLVHGARERFLAEAERSGAPVVVLDIPLLFETGGDSALRRGGGGLGAGRRAARARLRAARHERSRSLPPSWPSRCRTRKSAGAPISWWIPRKVSSRPRPGA